MRGGMGSGDDVGQTERLTISRGDGIDATEASEAGKVLQQRQQELTDGDTPLATDVTIIMSDGISQREASDAAKVLAQRQDEITESETLAVEPVPVAKKPARKKKTK